MPEISTFSFKGSFCLHQFFFNWRSKPNQIPSNFHRTDRLTSHSAVGWHQLVPRDANRLISLYFGSCHAFVIPCGIMYLLKVIGPKYNESGVIHACRRNWSSTKTKCKNGILKAVTIPNLNRKLTFIKNKLSAITTRNTSQYYYTSAAIFVISEEIINLS